MSGPDDSAFIMCDTCKMAFYIEVISDVDEYPLPTWCPFCGGHETLGDLENILDQTNTAVETALRRNQLAVIEGGRATKRPKEDRNAEERSRATDADHRQQDEGDREGDGGGAPSQR